MPQTTHQGTRKPMVIPDFLGAAYG